MPSFDKASEAFAKIGGELNELSSKVGGELNVLSSKVGDELNGLTNKVQDALPIDNELINKLTLRSDDLVREHELLDAQEKRKELVREYLSELLPWETKDESQMILVDKCREEILKLSQDRSTFETPFQLEQGIMFNPSEISDEGEESEEEVNFEEGDEKSNEEHEGVTEEKAEIKEVEKDEGIDSSIIAESAVKLEKMQPLPLLLEHFDIDTHVGLIERVLEVDDKLVSMHFMLSGAGEKENTFWRNYFFHCAYTRYENGLSIEEIWSTKPKAIITGEDMTPAASDQRSEPSLDELVEDESSVEMEYENTNLSFDDEKQSTHSGSISTANNEVEYSVEAGKVSATSPSTAVNTNSDSSGSGTSYEMINETSAEEGDAEDLDDLEAEIARELGEY